MPQQLKWAFMDFNGNILQELILMYNTSQEDEHGFVCCYGLWLFGDDRFY